MFPFVNAFVSGVFGALYACRVYILSYVVLCPVSRAVIFSSAPLELELSSFGSYLPLCSFVTFCYRVLSACLLSYVVSALSYNEIEYFVYVNLLIVSLLLFYVILFMLIYSSTLILNSVFYNDVFIEVIMTFVSFLYILLIISPGLLLFLDYDFIFSAVNFNVYILGYQWA